MKTSIPLSTTLLLSACVSTGQCQVDPPSVPAVYGRGDASATRLWKPPMTLPAADRRARRRLVDRLRRPAAGPRDRACAAGQHRPGLGRAGGAACTPAGRAERQRAVAAAVGQRRQQRQSRRSTRAPTGTAAVRPGSRWSGKSTVGPPAHPARHRAVGSPGQRGRPAEHGTAGDRRRGHAVLGPSAYLNQSIAAGEANLGTSAAYPGTGAGPLHCRCGMRLEVRQATAELEAQRAAQSALEQQRVASCNG